MLSPNLVPMKKERKEKIKRFRLLQYYYQPKSRTLHTPLLRPSHPKTFDITTTCKLQFHVRLYFPETELSSCSESVSEKTDLNADVSCAPCHRITVIQQT